MARKRRRLGQYVKDRKEKYQRKKKPNYLVHVSNSPRKILYPRITPFAWDIVDDERATPLLFLSPVQEISNWLGWCYYKEIRKINKYGYCLLYIHVIKVKQEEIFHPKKRYDDEFVTRFIQKPIEIIPIRYYPEYNYANLHALFSKLKIIKNYHKRN